MEKNTTERFDLETVDSRGYLVNYDVEVLFVDAKECDECCPQEGWYWIEFTKDASSKHDHCYSLCFTAKGEAVEDMEAEFFGMPSSSTRLGET